MTGRPYRDATHNAWTLRELGPTPRARRRRARKLAVWVAAWLTFNVALIEGVANATPTSGPNWYGLVVGALALGTAWVYGRGKG